MTDARLLMDPAYHPRGKPVHPRDEAIERIAALWPPDSEWPENAAIGRQDMLDALAEHWRELPLKVLQSMAARQTRRDCYDAS